MYRGTTPYIQLKIKNDDFDMSLIEVCHVSIESEGGGSFLTITNPVIDVENKSINFRLTQDQTLLFDVGKIKIQAKVKLNSGSVVSSIIVRTTMKEILEEAIM